MVKNKRALLRFGNERRAHFFAQVKCKARATHVRRRCGCGKGDVSRTIIEYYWKILQKRWKLMVICFVVTGLAVFTGSKLMTPMFQSTAFIQVAVSSNN